MLSFWHPEFESRPPISLPLYFLSTYYWNKGIKNTHTQKLIYKNYKRSWCELIFEKLQSDLDRDDSPTCSCRHRSRMLKVKRLYWWRKWTWKIPEIRSWYLWWSYKSFTHSNFAWTWGNKFWCSLIMKNVLVTTCSTLEYERWFRFLNTEIVC